MADDLGTVVLVSGAVGDPGQRVFYLQAQSPLGVYTVKCEKGQVAALAEHLEQLLADLPAIGATALIPTDLKPSLEPPRFVLGTIGIAYDADTDRVVVVLEELVVPSDDEDEDDMIVADRDGLPLELTRGAASVFCSRAKEIVAAGRPACR